jgi:RHS repeat-associated protein
MATRATDVSPAIWQWTAQGTARATARRRDVGHPLLLRTAWALVALLALGLPSRADAQAADTPNFTIEYHHADLSGNIRLTTDEYGAVVREAIHLPFGERDTGECGTLEDGARPLGYQGKPRDPKTCLDDFGARDYRAAIGRFQTVDPVLPVDRALRDPQQWNRYAYARNNPLIYTDPDGRVIQALAAWAAPYAVAASAIVMRYGQQIAQAAQRMGQAAWVRLSTLANSPVTQEAATFTAEVLTGQELGPGGAPPGGGANGRQVVGELKRAVSGTVKDIVVIGRQVDTAVAKNWPGHKILDIRDWTIVKNDEFIQSVIQNGQTVYIGSPQTRATLWDAANNRPTVFARELEQLRAAGYTQHGNYMVPPQ